MLKKALQKETGKKLPMYAFHSNYGSFHAHTTARSKDADKDDFDDDYYRYGNYGYSDYRISCEVVEDADVFCCGVFSLGEWNLIADEDVSQEAKVRLVTYLIKQIVEKGREYYQATTIQDPKDKESKEMYEVIELALKRAGFKNTACVKSNHGNYPIRVWHYFGKPYMDLIK